MKNKIFTVAAMLGLAAMLSGSALVAPAQAAGFQRYYGDRTYDGRGDRGERPSRLREVIDRTQSDLRDAEALEHNKNNQWQRYKDAQGHLSSFDRKLTKGKFDRGELDKSIGKLRQILDKNVLQASSRDMLARDLDDLRVARAHRDY